VRTFLLALVFLAAAIDTASAHGGGLDVCGGHHDRKNGTYDVHNWALYRNCHPNTGKPAESTPDATKPSEQTSSEEAKSATVWVTATGKKYHRETCRYLTSTRRPMGLAEARVRYAPCKVCRPDSAAGGSQNGK